MLFNDVLKHTRSRHPLAHLNTEQQVIKKTTTAGIWDILLLTITYKIYTPVCCSHVSEIQKKIHETKVFGVKRNTALHLINKSYVYINLQTTVKILPVGC